MVEVSLALAIVAVGLLAIIGLLPSGYEAARNATDVTLSATIVQDVFSEFRSQPFSSVKPCGTCSPVNLNNSGNVTIYYDKDGFETNSAGAYFRVNVAFNNTGLLQMSRLSARVVWPHMSAAPVNTNTYSTVVSLYDRP
jgi:uncharacterized protein (TIGR02598 family)